jgi:hypothetical protein
MAHVATIRVLVRDDNKERVLQGLHEMLQAAQTPVDPQDPGQQSWLAEFTVDHLQLANPFVAKALLEGADAQGLLDTDYPMFSPSAFDGEGAFWSETHGWVDIKLATAFTAGDPIDAEFWQGTDAYLMPRPVGLTFYRVLLVESPNQAELDHTPIAFECWAENKDHANEQAQNAYPGCKILEVNP